MEGVGSHSRLARTTSRYGQASSSSTAFNGPVRRWEKRWVHVSASLPSAPRHHSSKSSQSNGHKNNGAGLRLYRWTPLSQQPTSGGGDNGTAKLEEPPRRKFRYTPIAVFDEHRKEVVKRTNNEAKSEDSNQYRMKPALENDEIYGMLNINHGLMGEHKAADLNLAVHPECRPSCPDLDGRNRESLPDILNLSGFWPAG
ncbi:hypothetical protein Nepgr_026208 [Nepenthes gracilis]|uniref:Uncharacterized protein n=1 Tax=Nepenthes gracilis TaxID=150966 RepID=A0AAD3T6I7_NEPGR|nr:hypothetical protein Nepgr_026208 [Nepenthes gracilis]